MANNTKKKSTRSQSKKPTPKPLSKETSPSQEELARQLLPPYVPIDFSVPPVHLELVNKKIRALKKKLRKIYDIEQTLKDGSKKITKEQQDSLINKQALERNLADFEEIRESVEQIDLSAQLRLVWSLVFFFIIIIFFLAILGLFDLCTMIFVVCSCWVFFLQLLVHLLMSSLALVHFYFLPLVHLPHIIHSRSFNMLVTLHSNFYPIHKN